jgi:hypothetical protein
MTTHWGIAPDQECWGILANHREGDEKISAGSQCWLSFPNNGDGYARNEMCARSRGRRWIRIWIEADRLDNWRVKFVHPAVRGRVYQAETREKAEAYLAEINECFAFDRKHREAKAGHGEVGI